MADPNQQSSGVEDLIQQLKNKGVDAGKKEAEALVEEAHRKAAQIVAKKRSHNQTDESLSRYLSRRGFPSDIVYKAVRDSDGLGLQEERR